MDVWDKDFLDLVETAHLTFKGAADGEIAFGALKGFLDVRYRKAPRPPTHKISLVLRRGRRDVDHRRRSRAHSSSVIGLSEEMYLPSTWSTFCASLQRSGMRFFIQKMQAVTSGGMCST
jgi:hypothetical protein